jgi:hypothetical protein
MDARPDMPRSTTKSARNNYSDAGNTFGTGAVARIASYRAQYCVLMCCSRRAPNTEAVRRDNLEHAASLDHREYQQAIPLSASPTQRPKTDTDPLHRRLNGTDADSA